MDKVKGIYKHGDKWKVRKYDRHIGVYDTYYGAVEASIRADEEHIVDKYKNQYFEARDWLRLHGHLSYSSQ